MSLSPTFQPPPSMLLVFNCYKQTFGSPGFKNDTFSEPIIQEENAVPFGSARQWQTWQKETEEKIKVLSIPKDREVYLTGVAPQPMFVFLGKKLAEAQMDIRIDEFLNFNQFTKEYENWKLWRNTAQEDAEAMFNEEIKEENLDDDKKNKIHLHFSLDSKFPRPELKDEKIGVYACLCLKNAIKTTSFNQAQTEISQFISGVLQKFQGREIVLTTSMPNPVNFYIGSLLQEVKGMVVYDFINRNYEKADLQF